MKKILIIFGTRPEAIKMAPLVKEFQNNLEDFDTKVCITAQHREMLDQVLTLFDIVPDYDLNIMKPGQNLFDLTSSILLNIKKILEDFVPDLVLVHGDTSTACVSSMATYYSQIKVGHIEAGLRTNNIYSPWPEEVNRQIVGVIASLHFAPTIESKNNLLRENKNKNTIFITGNTVIDAMFYILQKIDNNKNIKDLIGNLN